MTTIAIDITAYLGEDLIIALECLWVRVLINPLNRDPHPQGSKSNHSCRTSQSAGALYSTNCTSTSSIHGHSR
jgi:hypothetical protein